MAIRNVLFIITDQQRKDSLGCYGDRGAQTPNIDKLAAHGITFNRCYVTNPICTPNRLSIFTGMYPHNHGIWTNGLMPEHELPTLPGYLADNGFQTASFGKIHFTPYNGNAGNLESASYWKETGDNFDWNGPYWGFQTVELTIGHTNPIAHYGRWFREKGGTPEMLELHRFKNPVQAGVRKIPPELHDSSFVAERVSEFLSTGRDKTKPFFITASFPDPHHPFNPPEALANKYRNFPVRPPVGDSRDLATRPIHYTDQLNGAWNRWGKTEPKHQGGLSQKNCNELIYLTHAMVELIDDSVGQILRTLEQENLVEETLIIFTSDHGELLGDHGLWLKGPFFYDGLVNVPLVVSCPGFAVNMKLNHLVSHIDLYPSICDILGLTAPPHILGRSIVPQMSMGAATRDHCLLEYRNGYGDEDIASAVYIDDEFKFAAYENGEYELTDLKSDPDEKINIASSSEPLVQKYNGKLLRELLAAGNRHPAQVGHA
jgi:arylsulfatase A-like enzyme